MKVTLDSGATVDMGRAEAGPTISIIDYSRRVTDDFGVTSIVRRNFSRRMALRVAVPIEAVDNVQRQLADLRAKPATWIADARFAGLSFRGYYRDFEITVGALSVYGLTVESLASDEAFIDPGTDPAPNQRASSLRYLDPVAIDDDVLVSSTVPENDAPAWSAGTSYAKSARVVAAHRLYESLVAGNVGNDPATAAAQWLDTGPTNRHAMLDQALGTATIVGADVEVVLRSAEPVSGLALLDTNASTVRVRAPGYDRTQVPDIAGKALFLDLAVPAGTRVTVTATPATVTPGPQRWDDGAQWLDQQVWRDSLAAGDGTVTIGTLLLGQIKGLGVTEDAPTAGIIDYSRKEVDDFGELTVVPRAWAKRMAGKAMIRTNAVDLVTSRLAAARSKPCLWLGHNSIDALAIYGFYRDFDIAVGENVSTLSLNIEGLSKAAPVVPTTGGSVAWPDITDPTGTKPKDGADKTGENTSKDTNAVGGKPAGDVLTAIDAAKARVDEFERTTIPAVNKAVADAGERITAARDRADAAGARADQALTNIDAEIQRALGAEASINQRVDAISASGGYDDTAIRAEAKRIDETAISRDAARARQIESVSATLTDADATIKAEAKRIDEAAVSRDSALGRRVDQVATSIETTDAAWRTETQRIETQAVNRDGATNQRIDTLIAEGGGGSEGVDTVARAEISRVDTAAVTRDDALGSRIDTIKSSVDTVDTRIAAKAEEVTTAYTRVTDALASRSSSLEASAAAASGGTINPNPNFSAWQDPSAAPDGWAHWSRFDPTTRVANPLARGGYALDHSPQGINSGVVQGGVFVDSGWFVFEASAWLLSGDWVGAGVTLSGLRHIDFFRDPDSAGRTGNVNGDGGVRTWTKLVEVGGTSGIAPGYLNWHLMGNWEGFAGFHPKVIRWLRCALRPASDAEVKAQKADATLNNPGGIVARVKATEDAFVDLPNRYATAQRAATLEAQLARTSPSAMNDALNFVNGRIDTRETAIRASIDDRATVIADEKAGAVAQTVQTLRTEYNGTKQEVSDQRGVINQLNGKSAAYVRLIADAGNGRAALSLWSDQYGGAWQLVGNGIISGDLTVDGSITARKFNGASMARMAQSVWTGDLRPNPGQTIVVPWSVVLPSIPPVGRFIYEFTYGLASNAGTTQIGTDDRGRPYYVNYVEDGGGLFIQAVDNQGNIYRPRTNASDFVIATTDFVPNFTALVRKGNRDQVVDGGDHVNHFVAANYFLTRIDLKVTWVAI